MVGLSNQRLKKKKKKPEDDKTLFQKNQIHILSQISLFFKHLPNPLKALLIKICIQKV